MYVSTTIMCPSHNFVLAHVGISGFQRRGLSSGQHTFTVRATSTASGLTVADSRSFNVNLNAIRFSGITGE